MFATEEIVPRARVGLKTEERRMARVRDENRYIFALRHFARVRCCRVQHDNRRSAVKLVDDAAGDFPDEPVGHCEDCRVGAGDSRIDINAFDGYGVLQPRATFRRQFHVVHGEP